MSRGRVRGLPAGSVMIVAWGMVWRAWRSMHPRPPTSCTSLPGSAAPSSLQAGVLRQGSADGPLEIAAFGSTGFQPIGGEAAVVSEVGDLLWGLALGADAATLTSPDPQSERRFEVVGQNLEAGRRLVMLREVGTGSKTRVELVREPCSDGMADIVYAYRASLVGEGVSYGGCGLRLRP